MLKNYDDDADYYVHAFTNIESMNISLESNLKLRSFVDSIKQLNEHDAKLLLIDLFKNQLAKDKLYNELLLVNWGLKCQD